jgi:transcriptional regulator with XRE-family HTH domain
MTKSQFQNALTQLKYTQKDMAVALGISLKSVNDYANGASIPKSVANHVQLLVNLSELLVDAGNGL